MDLFVINRYREDYDDLDSNQENKHLLKLKKEIEERKKLNTLSKTISRPATELVITEDGANAKETDLNIDDKHIDVQKTIRELTSEHDIIKQDFKVLGGNDFEKKPKVQRILPYWLSHSYSISKNVQNQNFPVEKQTWLHGTLKSTLMSEGITHLFPVQAEVIPFILQEYTSSPTLWPHDVCVSAPTGSGKTLAFVIPIIQLLMQEASHHIRAMVVLPVQELATQIAKVFKKYCVRTGLKVALLSGSVPLQQEQQKIVQYTESAGWVSEADIIVCTAGRLVEHIQNTEGFCLKHLKFLIIDEADRIMDQIQNDWLFHLVRHVNLENGFMSGKVSNLNWSNLRLSKPPPQKLLFSATLSQDPEKLEQWGLFQPKLFSALPVQNIENYDHLRQYTTPDELKEEYVMCTVDEKPEVLYHFLVEQKWDKVLCFTNAAQTAHRLTVLLNTWGKGIIQVAELSSALDRSNRDAVLKKFTQSEINVLIGTDALARGIDIPNCNYVISYDPPRNIKTYIHRVGRTGRAGRTGKAVTILLQNQMSQFKDIIKSGGKTEVPEIKLESDLYNNISECYQSALKETKLVINSEIITKVKKSIKVKRGFKPEIKVLKS